MEDLIKLCHYYNGEKESPFSDDTKSLLWFYERGWVHSHKDYSFENEIEEYLSVGLSDFCDDDGVPLTYKALLFNRFAQSFQSMLEAVEPFKIFYKKYYRE